MRAVPDWLSLPPILKLLLSLNIRGPCPMSRATALFSVGTLIHHRLFQYRGVIFDVDPVYQGTEEWYAQMARSRPPNPGTM